MRVRLLDGAGRHSMDLGGVTVTREGVEVEAVTEAFTAAVEAQAVRPIPGVRGKTEIVPAGSEGSTPLSEFVELDGAAPEPPPAPADPEPDPEPEFPLGDEDSDE